MVANVQQTVLHWEARAAKDEQDKQEDDDENNDEEEEEEQDNDEDERKHDADKPGRSRTRNGTVLGRLPSTRSGRGGSVPPWKRKANNADAISSEWSPTAFYEVVMYPVLCTAACIMTTSTLADRAAYAASLRWPVVAYDRAMLWIAASCSEAHVWITLTDTEEERVALHRQHWGKWGEWGRRTAVWAVACLLLGGLLFGTYLVDPQHSIDAAVFCIAVCAPRILYVAFRHRHAATWTPVRTHTTYSILLYASMIINAGLLYSQLMAAGNLRVVTWINTLLSTVVQPMARAMSIYILELAAQSDLHPDTADYFLSRVLPARVRALHMAYSMTGSTMLYIPLPSLAWFLVSLASSAVSGALTRRALRFLHRVAVRCQRQCARAIRWIHGERNDDEGEEEDEDDTDGISTGDEGDATDRAAGEGNRDTAGHNPASRRTARGRSAPQHRRTGSAAFEAFATRSYRNSIRSVVSVSLAWVAVLTNVIAPMMAVMMGMHGPLLVFAVVHLGCEVAMRMFKSWRGEFRAPRGWHHYIRVGKQQFGVMWTQGAAVVLLSTLVHRHAWRESVPLDAEPANGILPATTVGMWLPVEQRFAWSNVGTVV